jgi:hypothetical protein
MEQKWFEMTEIHKRRFDSAVWIPLRASKEIETGKRWHVGYKSEYFGAGSLALPRCSRNDASIVDFEHRILSVEDTKTTNTRHIPLNDAALAAFRALERKKTGKFVFLRVPGHGADSRTGVKSPREWFDDAVDKAKIEKLTWHALRHASCLSRAIVASAALLHLRQMILDPSR